MNTYVGAIEAGGTKFLCSLGTPSGEIITQERFPTTSPEETVHRCIEFFKNQKHQIEALGIATFGPIDVDKSSPTWGYITSTPKPGWQDTDLVGMFSAVFDIPIGFDTDVDGSLLGEYTWGAGKGLDTVLYLTIGTGIGGGLLANGELVHGMLHPEMGHIILPLQPADEERQFYGICPFHKGCFEGLVCGPAIEKRYGIPGHKLSSDHEVWELLAQYIATALHSYTCITSPQKIILGGGVMDQPVLLPLIREKLLQSLNGYIQTSLLKEIENYVVEPALGNQSGSKGALMLAALAK